MHEPDAESDRQRLQRQYAEIAALAGGLAHEIRNPLSTIQLNLELLLEDLGQQPDPAAQRVTRKLRTIQSECGRLDGVLDAFLQFARAGQLNLEDTPLADLIREFLEFHQAEAAAHRIDIRAHLAGDLPTLRIDQLLFRQLLGNLIRNAEQAMPRGGSIELQAYRSDGGVMLELIDTGPGIPAESLPKIFDPFYSTKSGGSGLGLPTVKKIVEAHGGRIACESEPGKGTKFTIQLPGGEGEAVKV